jgi:hypothetical protein
MRTSMVLVLLAVVVGGIACSSSTSGLQTAFTATLNNSYVVPAVNPTAGAASFTLNVNGSTISGQLVISDDPTGNDAFTTGHIHTGVSGSAGAVLLNLCGTPAVAATATSKGQQATPACTGTINWSYTSGSPAGMPVTPSESYTSFVTSLSTEGDYVQGPGLLTYRSAGTAGGRYVPRPPVGSLIQ